MKKQELNEALLLAKSKKQLNMSDLAMFDGFGLPDFQPVTCTVEALAMLVRWQSVQLNGEIDPEALNEIAACGKCKFTIVGI